MPARRRRHAPDINSSVNLTPLIDVALVLVLILLVTTPLTMQSSIALQSARASARKAKQVTQQDRIELDVSADGGFRVNREPVPEAALVATLTPLIAASASRTVIVRCDDAVPHGTFVHAVDTARQAGASRVAVVGG